MTESPSSTPIAMMPPARGLRNDDRSVFLITPLRRAHHDELLIFLLRELLHRQQRGDLLPLLHRHQVRDRLALAARADVGNLVDLQPVGAAAVGEDHDVGVRGGHEQVADEVLLARAHADAPLAAAPLRAVGRDRASA